MEPISANVKDYGSFKHSMRAPIHRWFAYPAGYSYRLIDEKICDYKLGNASLIMDPFVGTGTTSVVAKLKGVNSIGLEAHPFVHWVANVKLFWDYDLNELMQSIEEVVTKAVSDNVSIDPDVPLLVEKCFTADNLQKLLRLRKAINSVTCGSSVRDFLKLALTSTLRIASSAGTGWPYIAPSKYQAKLVNRDAIKEFQKQSLLMYEDVIWVRELNNHASKHKIVLGDARSLSKYVPQGEVDLLITSPPYLNNYDYADRTRLETYFWGMYHNWREISEHVRSKLMMAATTQVVRSRLDGILELPKVAEHCPDVYQQLLSAVDQLGKLRLQKPGKKSYDAMVAGYFEDFVDVLTEAHLVLKPGHDFVLVLGDSAPYGVYIPTDLYIGRLATAIGFSSFHVEAIRTRGGKWGHNPQRHKVMLRESIVTITK